MNEMTKNLDHYMKLPYAIVLRQDEEKDWIARVEELSGCVAHGATSAEALENVEEVKRLWIEDALETGNPIPEPLEEALPSGKWLQRVPRSLHKRLAEIAEREGVSLNQFVTSVLAEAVGRRTTATRHVHDAAAFVGQVLAKEHRAYGMSFSEQTEMAVWKVRQPKPTAVIDLNGVITAQVLALPDKLDESHFKVNDRVIKKELAFKA